MPEIVAGDAVAEMREGVVLCADARAVLPSVPDGSVDMIFTDPPYGHTEHGSLAQRSEAVRSWSDGVGKYREGAYAPIVANDGPEANDLVQWFFAEAARVLVPDGCCCCCCCGGGPDPQFARWSLWLDAAFNGGFKQMVVWDKGPMGMGWHYRRSYETVLVAQKKGAACKWYDDTSRIENIVRPGDYGIRKIIPQRNEHPTAKPWQLAALFIGLHTREGETVLDPFAGAGSTLIACHNLKRRFLGCEIDPKWTEIANLRLTEPHRVNAVAFADKDALAGLPMWGGKQ